MADGSVRDPPAYTPPEAAAALVAGPHQRNSFDVLRLSAALLVLVGHAYALLHWSAPRLLDQSIHRIGLYVFFFISGYLIAASWRAQPGLVAFAIKRVLRIMPALVVVVVATALILGPLVTSDPGYLQRPQTWVYLVRNALLLTGGDLPGVFLDNPQAGSVNGSLWTLPIEALLYTLTPLLMRARLWQASLFAVALFFTGWFYDGYLSNHIAVASWFLVGHLAYRLRVPPPNWPPLRLPVDLSYGLYLTSFPVQQTLIMAFPALHPLQLAAWSLAICVVLAWMLWAFVEQPAKRLRAPLIAWSAGPGALAPRPAP